MNTYGRVYISTAGRGIAYIESASVARLVTTPSNVTALDSADIKITAFPNPVNSALTIRLTEDLKGGNIFLLNSSGQLVFARKANSSLMTIEMANMPADVYSLKVEGKTRSFVKKIVKK